MGLYNSHASRTLNRMNYSYIPSGRTLGISSIVDGSKFAWRVLWPSLFITSRLKLYPNRPSYSSWFVNYVLLCPSISTITSTVRYDFRTMVWKVVSWVGAKVRELGGQYRFEFDTDLACLRVYCVSRGTQHIGFNIYANSQNSVYFMRYRISAGRKSPWQVQIDRL